MKEEDIWFVKWERNTFGSGYGTGEMPILSTVKVFFNSIEDRMYNFQKLELLLGETVCWLVINALAKVDNIEWGTSSRFGWLTPSGELLKKYFDSKTNEELYEICMTNEDICECNGEIKEHKDCKQPPFLDEKYAWQLLNQIK